MAEFHVHFRVHPKGEPEHEFTSVVEAPDAATALRRAHEAGLIATVTTWQDLGEIKERDFSVSLLGDETHRIGAIVAVGE